jgi:hypothetical protein
MTDLPQPHPEEVEWRIDAFARRYWHRADDERRSREAADLTNVTVIVEGEVDQQGKEPADAS